MIESKTGLAQSAMTYNRSIEDMEKTLLDKIHKVSNVKHRTDLLQEYDKMVHYHTLALRKFNDLYGWFLAFGVDGDAAENS